jgi:hypothetical protein
MEKYSCEACKDSGVLPDGSGCRDCCEHEIDPDEGYTCLNCGYDGSGDYAAAAYDRYKDFMKYGG